MIFFFFLLCFREANKKYVRNNYIYIDLVVSNQTRPELPHKIKWMSTNTCQLSIVTKRNSKYLKYLDICILLTNFVHNSLSNTCRETLILSKYFYLSIILSKIQCCLQSPVQPRSDNLIYWMMNW